MLTIENNIFLLTNNFNEQNQNNYQVSNYYFNLNSNKPITTNNKYDNNTNLYSNPVEHSQNNIDKNFIKY